MLKGVTLGDNTVVGANSTVTKSLLANVIACGKPERVIHMLGNQGTRSMARILIISNTVPHAPGSGSPVREFNLVRVLSQNHQITYLLSNYSKEQTSKAEVLSQLCKVRMYEPFRSRSTLMARLNWSVQQRIPVSAVARRVLGPPLLVQELATILWGLERALRQIDWSMFDVVQIAHSHMAAIVRRVSIPIPIIVDWHNVYTEYYRRTASTTQNWNGRFVLALEQNRMRRHEQWVLKHTSRAVAVSSTDELHIRTLWPDAKTAVVPNGVDCEYFNDPMPANHSADRLIFTGTMDYAPNTEAVLFFSEQVLPIIWRSKPAVQFYVVGKNPNGQVCALAERFPGKIVVTGAVDDVRPFLQDAAIAVVPLLNGSGTRLKILEAMAMQKAVVSTSVGAEGLEVVHGRDILIADSPSAFAICVLSLLQDKSSHLEIARQGNHTVRDRYDWRKIGAGLSEVWEEVVRENGR